uniref:Putative secreted protein n=1 Tax=Anopheles darlingi TaxID=43151 RepID=A0A2M4D3S5_ANODA
MPTLPVWMVSGRTIASFSGAWPPISGLVDENSTPVSSSSPRFMRRVARLLSSSLADGMSVAMALRCTVSSISCSGGVNGMASSQPLTSRFISTELLDCSWSRPPTPPFAVPLGQRAPPDPSCACFDLDLSFCGNGDGAISCCSSCGADVDDDDGRRRLQTCGSVAPASLAPFSVRLLLPLTVVPDGTFFVVAFANDPATCCGMAFAGATWLLRVPSLSFSCSRSSNFHVSQSFTLAGITSSDCCSDSCSVSLMRLVALEPLPSGCCALTISCCCCCCWLCWR